MPARPRSTESPVRWPCVSLMLLEMIDVEHQHRQVAAMAACSRNLFFQQRVQPLAIGQIGQAVGHGHAMDDLVILQLDVATRQVFENRVADLQPIAPLQLALADGMGVVVDEGAVGGHQVDDEQVAAPLLQAGVPAGHNRSVRRCHCHARARRWSRTCPGHNAGPGRPARAHG